MPLKKISLPNLFLFSIWSDNKRINSNFFNCNFNFSATSNALNSSFDLNDLIGKTIKIDFSGEINCIECGVKINKTQDEKSILIELENSGWKFSCKDHKIDVETGLYFGKKNSFVENQNIFISGLTHNEDQEIIWKIVKI